MQKGLAPIGILIVILLVAAVAVGGYLFIKKPWGPVYMSPLPAVSPPACTQEAKICPDGTSVGRTGSNCEFSACSSKSATSSADTANWKTYTNLKLGILFRYPADWLVSEDTAITIVPQGNGQVIEIHRIDNPENLSLELYEQKHVGGSGMGPGIYDPSAKSKVISGVTFYYSQNTFCEPAYCDKYVASYKGKIWQFILFQPTEEKRKIFDQIVASFKFI